MSQCTHDLFDRENACVDGMCPICSQASVAELVEALQMIDHEVKDNDLSLSEFPSLDLEEAHRICDRVAEIIDAVLTKHAPAQSKDDDPTPWCHVCGARVREQCGCGNYAENN